MSRPRAERPPELLFSFFVAPSSSHWIRSSAINERNVCTFSTDHETDHFLIVLKRCARSKPLRSFKKISCVRSFAVCADLNLAGLVSRIASSMTQVMQCLPHVYLFVAARHNIHIDRHKYPPPAAISSCVSHTRARL